jgi:hypothetical protein
MYAYLGRGLHGGNNGQQINNKRGRGNCNSTRTLMRPLSTKKVATNMWQGCGPVESTGHQEKEEEEKDNIRSSQQDDIDGTARPVLLCPSS